MTTLIDRLGRYGLLRISLTWLGLGLALVVTLGALGAPPWGVPLLAGTLVAILPFVLVLAWALRSRRFEGRRPRD